MITQDDGGEGVIGHAQESIAHDGLSCRTCGARDVQLHFDCVAPPERVSDLVVRDRGRCIACVVQGQ
ncbi:hypothetical protein [Kitasatospora sp. NPDC001175]|uniref:hypothetical protein n=1 Tax=Kitasatospora sp. NPDC001175 TaxID=3157103 RepID=UPI003CFD0527